MHLQLFTEDLMPENRNFNNIFEIEISDFMPKVENAIVYVLDNGGRATFYWNTSYVAIMPRKERI